MKLKESQMPAFWSSLVSSFQKDLLLEWRSPGTFLTALLFSLVLATLYAYTLEAQVFFSLRNLDGLLLATLFFASVLLSSHNSTAEREADALRIIAMSPVDPAGLYIGKMLALWHTQLIFLLLYMPLYYLLLQGGFPQEFSFYLAPLFCLSLAALSLAALGVFLAPFSAGNRIRDILLPLLMLPTALPVLMVTVTLLSQCRQAGGLEGLSLQNILTPLAMALLYGVVGANFYFFMLAEE